MRALASPDANADTTYTAGFTASAVQETFAAAASTAVSAVDALETVGAPGASGAANAATGTNEEATRNIATNN